MTEQIQTAPKTEWRGHITDVAHDVATFTFTPVHGQAFTAAAPESLRAEAAAGLERYQKNTFYWRDDALMLLAGVPELDSGGEPTILDRATLTALPSDDVIARIDTMYRLTDNWFEPGDKAPSAAGLDWLSEMFSLYYPRHAPRPFASPMGDGGVNLQWDYERITIEIDINIDARIGEFILFTSHDRPDNIEENTFLDLSQPAAWRWLADKATAVALYDTGAPSGDNLQEAEPPLDIRATALVAIAELPAHHPLIHSDAEWAITGKYQPADDNGSVPKIVVGEDTFAPFAQATMRAPFATGRNPRNCIIQISGKLDNNGLFRAIETRADKPMLIYVQSPAEQRLCGAFKVHSLTAVVSPDNPDDEEWMATLAQISQTLPGWYQY